MDVDSAQYADISREMSETGEYLQVKHRGRDYLDKPPLLFWVNAVLFKVFGVHNWVFKLGSFLFTLLGVYSTYRLGRFLYNKKVGLLAALILYTSQAYFLFNNDVRTDTILSATVIFAIWQWMEWLRNKKWKWLLGLGVGISLAMLAKGPIGLIVPVLAVGGYLVSEKRWRDFFHWQYLLVLFIIAICLSPMLYGLYQQFDKQPDKTTMMVSPEGLIPVKGVSGVKFYLWTQSFGRISGENVWKDNTGPFFFVHNFLWSFLPWSLLFVLALFSRCREWIKSFGKKKSSPEMLTALGFLLPFLALSTSSFKLPHYIFPLYSLAAILIAAWWYNVLLNKGSAKYSWLRLSFWLQLLVLFLSISLSVVIFVWFFPQAPWYLIAISTLLSITSCLFLFQYKKKDSLMKAVLIGSISVNFVMNAWFYPSLMQFQAGSNMVKMVTEKGIPKDKVFLYRYFSFSYSYYSDGGAHLLNKKDLEARLSDGKETYVICDKKNAKRLEKSYMVVFKQGFIHHAVTLLTMPFLMEKTRKENLDTLYLLKLEKQL